MSNLLQYCSVVYRVQTCLKYQVPGISFVMLIICGLSLSIGIADVFGASDDPEVLFQVVVEGIRENSQKLKCTAIVWEITEKRRPSNIYPEGVEAEGIFRLWWDGKKIATKSNQNLSGIEEEQIRHHTVYDGEEFHRIKDVNKPTSIGLSNKTNYMPHENWFEHILWPGPDKSTHKSIIDDLNTFQKRKDILCTWSVAEMDGSELIKLVSRNINMKEGTYGIRYFDPSKGFNLVCREGYFDGKMDTRKTVELHRSSGGAWFPVETNLRFLDPNTGTTVIHRTMKIDMEESSFNDPSMIPAGVFHIDITNDMTILDHRSGRFLRYKKDMTPLVMEDLEEAANDFMNESSSSVPIEPTKSEQVDAETDAKPDPVQTEIRDDLPKPLLQTTPDRSSRRIARWIAIAIGMGLIILGAAGWYLRKRPSSAEHTD